MTKNLEPRKRIPNRLRKEILAKNRGVCCVCHDESVGVNLHHIDEQPANNFAENIAVICVREHDRYHRPGAYCDTISELEMREAKAKWESFIEAVDNPDGDPVIANVIPHGSDEDVHSIQLAVQFGLEPSIGFVRTYSQFDGPLDEVIDRVFEALDWLVPSKDRLTVVLHPCEPVAYCECSAHGAYRFLSRVVDRAVVLRFRSDWALRSRAAIYLNDTEGSVTALIYWGEDDSPIDALTVHVCRRRWLHAHYADGKGELRIRVRRANVVGLAKEMISSYLDEWNVGAEFFGTGDPDEPDLLDGRDFAPAWQRAIRRAARVL